MTRFAGTYVSMVWFFYSHLQFSILVSHVRIAKQVSVINCCCLRAIVGCNDFSYFFSIGVSFSSIHESLEGYDRKISVYKVCKRTLELSSAPKESV